MPAQQVHARRTPQAARKGKLGGRKPELVLDGGEDPSQWLGFSLPPRASNYGGMAGPPRRSRRGDAWKGSALTREKFVNASFRFMLKPTDVVGYGAHFADPDISLHWPNILQVLVPTFSAYSVAQGFVDTDADDDEAGEEAAERRRRIDEERQGRSCPICLSKPVAGRMTKCGHIFCLPCILHFIALSDVPRAASCPICGDTIQESMLKSVRYLDAETMVSAAEGDTGGAPSAENAAIVSEARAIDESEAAAAAKGDESPTHLSHNRAHRIHMRLLHRPQMTTLALPATATWPSDAIPPISAPWYFLPDVLTYSRFALASPEYMEAELKRELEELRHEHNLLVGDELGRAFVKAAREKVEKQLHKVQDELMTPAVRKHEAEARRAWGDAVGGERREQEHQRQRERRAVERAAKEKENEEDLNVPLEFLAAGSSATYGNVESVRVPPNMVVEPNPMPNLDARTKGQRRKNRGIAAPPVSPAPAAAPAACFYQSSLGAHVYMSALDMRILITHFGSYDNLPPTLSFPTTGYDSATVNEDLRKRTKYLSHLPIGTEVVFVEANLAGIVPSDVLAKFEQPLKTRRDKRRARTRREDRDKKRWEEAERAKRPPEVHVVPSALSPVDADLARALEQSRLDAENTTHFPSMDSPPRPTHVPAPPSPTSSFASALRGPSTARAWVRQEEIDGAGVDAAWAGFGGEGEAGEEGRKKKGKKGKKLVFGGAGRQA
ncbi:hypothetical protein CC85DRAFT_273043 [Cutaneotrichosporon oleaginosum]|uniref:RING-type domain-containing protein n=1 Tax=Cutaneotrichosporon oleaginosum TaxID=879819 RepID=A0A0J0XQ25_9TREE|nr:uncharacterized protein CC85DRAFT_273043 [Cutaneotrichosporon oleaginosum]KLT43198.1 hypothetical protein CC85DRAFT_273043 [Cutaneotrichosporon oleaginosum]TXT09880.1 hypothetical protein COLE_03814 [Cutaneotrichosporon oleaginosum]